MTPNKSIIFKKVPDGLPVAGEHLTLEEHSIDLDVQPPPGGLLLQNLYFSFDPYQRVCMRPVSSPGFAPAYELGRPITNSSVSKVLRSSNDKFPPGDQVTVYMTCPFEEYSLLPAAHVSESVWKLDNRYGLDPIHFLGPLGMPGLTAYCFFYEIGTPKKGETFFVSAASGMVGQIAGQLAKKEGLRVVGSVGEQRALDYIVQELGFDDGFLYKKEDPFEALKRLCPEGLDVYYDNVGGAQLEAALDVMNIHGRIVACGMIPDYNKPFEKRYGVKNLIEFFQKRLTMRGFLVADLKTKYYDEHQRNLQEWIQDGSVKAQFTVTRGMENGIEGLLGMFSGKNFGKGVLKVV